MISSWDNIQFEISRIDRGIFELPEKILEMDGYSSRKVRQLLNILCTTTSPRINYLEIGVHTGSTFIPAVYNNLVHATAVDNWSLMGNFRPEFEKNIKKYLPLPRPKISIIEDDFRIVDLDIMPHNVNVYFYDGDHGRDCQYQAFYRMKPVFADRFIAVVDDFNWIEPREETYRSIKDAGMTIENSVILPGPYNGSKDEWWNGLFVGIIRKGTS